MSENQNPAPEQEPTPAPAPEPKAEAPAPAPAPEPTPEPAPDPKKTIAEGGEQEPKEPEHKPYWPEDWRQKMAEHAAAGDKKAYEKELRRLERFTDPMAVYGMGRELEAKFSQGGLVKIPGKDATEEEKKAFNTALGVPEDPKEYIDNLKLPEGVTLGEQDKALASEFATDMHAVGLTQPQMEKAYGWYLKNQEQAAAEVDRQDDENHTESLKTLKEEFGPALNRHINALGTLFAYAPGGADPKNENSLYNRLLAGRMADGRIIGDDPDVIRFLATIAKEVNPMATVVESADGSGKGVDEEIAEIEKMMRTDRRAYDKDTKKQARYLELLEARNKHRARNAA